jgi:hypothetical protein
MSENLAEGIALSHALLQFVGRLAEVAVAAGATVSVCSLQDLRAMKRARRAHA